MNWQLALSGGSHRATAGQGRKRTAESGTTTHGDVTSMSSSQKSRPPQPNRLPIVCRIPAASCSSKGRVYYSSCHHRSQSQEHSKQVAAQYETRLVRTWWPGGLQTGPIERLGPFTTTSCWLGRAPAAYRCGPLEEHGPDFNVCSCFFDMHFHSFQKKKIVMSLIAYAVQVLFILVCSSRPGQK